MRGSTRECLHAMQERAPLLACVVNPVGVPLGVLWHFMDQSHAFVCGPNSTQQTSAFGGTLGHGAHQRHNLNNNSYNYTGGQYA